MSEGLVTGRRRPSLPAPAAPPDDDDLLWEILLRLPPLPSSLLRASLVCKRWRRLVSDPGFLRRFRAHHQTPPLLGFFTFAGKYGFYPTLDPPDRIPASRFSPPVVPGEHFYFVGCRHGLALLFNWTRKEAVVWNPVTGFLHCVQFPPDIWLVLKGAVLCTAGSHESNLMHFKIVLICVKSSPGHPKTAHVYRSESRTWDDVIEETLAHSSLRLFGPNVLVGNVLCWLMGVNSILQFDLDTQTLAVIKQPVGLPSKSDIHIMRTKDNRLGLAVTSGPTNIQLWERMADSNRLMRWVLQKTVELDKLIPSELSMKREVRAIFGFAEDTNAMFVALGTSVFMIQLESMQFKKVSESTMDNCPFVPYTNFFTAGI